MTHTMSHLESEGLNINMTQSMSHKKSLKLNISMTHSVSHKESYLIIEAMRQKEERHESVDNGNNDKESAEIGHKAEGHGKEMGREKWRGVQS